MKKAMAILIMLAMALSLSVVAFAVDSPVAGGVTVISKTTGNAEQDATLDVHITMYKDREDLSVEKKALIEQANDAITAAASVTDLSAAVKKALGAKFTNLEVSDLYDMTVFILGEEVHDIPVDLVLQIENAEKFAALLHMDEEGNWTVVDGAKINADGNLEATVPEYSPFAIVLGTANPADGIDIAIYASIMAAAAIAVVLVIRKSSKQSA